MAVAIPFIVQAAFTFLQASALLTAVATIATGLAVGAMAKRKAKRKARDAYNYAQEDRLVMVATADNARSRVYGRVRNCDGVIFKGTHGTKSEYLTVVVALAGHEIDAIETVYFGDVPVELSADSGSFLVLTEPFARKPIVTSQATMVVSAGTGSVVLPKTPISGSISLVKNAGNVDSGMDPGLISVVGNTVSVSGASSGTWVVNYQYQDLVPKVRLWKFLGLPQQDISTILASRFPSIISGSDRFSGIACLVVQMQYDTDAFPSGIPNISAVIRGAKVYDPRVGGVPVWTENPALIARDWALYANGGGCQLAEIIEPQFIAAANSCDVVTTFNTSAGNETRPLYQCGIVCPTNIGPDETFQEIVESMAGKWGWSGGKLSVVSGSYRSPVADIDDTWLSDIESINIIKDLPRTEVVNVYKPKIVNADGYVNSVATATSVSYTPTMMPEIRSSTFIDADGEEMPRTIELNAVTRNVHAQHICGVMMRESRDSMMVQLSCNMKAWPLQLFDTVTLTLAHIGFVAKQFEIIGWKYSVETGVRLSLRETDASIYNHASGLSVLDAALNTALPSPWIVSALTITSVTTGAAVEDDTSQTRALVSWTQSANESVIQSGKIEIQYTPASSSLPTGDWASMVVEGSATAATVTGLVAGLSYVFRIRAINSVGVRSVWSVQVTANVAVPQAVTDVSDAAAAAAAASAAAAAASAAAAAAQSAATTAQTSANAANAAIADLTSDNILSQVEKPPLILEVANINNEVTDILNKATAQAITTERTSYQNAYNALTSYLSGLTSPVAWNNLTGPTNITGTTFRSTFETYYSTRQILLNLIAVKIANGAVGTPQLAGQSATTTVSQTSLSGTVPANSNNFPIVSVSWVNNTGETIIVQAEYTIELTTSAGGTSNASAVLDVPGGSSAAYISPAIGTTKASFNKIIQKVAPIGATITATMEGFTSVGSSSAWDNAVVRLTAIKR